MSNYTYIVTNNINGKEYEGSHSWSGEGLDPNYYGSGTAITRAVKKYGKENFQVEVLYYYDTVEECRKDEERILTEYNVRDCPHSYNLKNSAIGMTSEDMTGEKNPNYGKRGKDSPWYGKHHTDATRKKLSQAKKGEKHPMYGKRGKDSPNYGKHRTEESRKKMSQAQKGKTVSEETRKKLSQAHKGLKHSEETRQKISQAKIGENNPNYGKRGKDTSMYGKHHTEETRRKLSQANNYKKIPVVAIQKDTGKIKIFESQTECARQLNLDKRNISKCLKGIYKSTGGYTFKYVEQLESGIYEGML